jgi:FO synthase
MPPEAMERLIRSCGRVPRQRTTTYGTPAEERVRASFGAAPLADVLAPPVREAGLRAPVSLVRPGVAGGLAPARAR